METKNIMIVGVGGQGTLLTSRILGGLAIAGGYDVKLSKCMGWRSAAAAWLRLSVMEKMWRSPSWKKARRM